MTPSLGAPPSSINFGYHLVLYIDLPGQRRELEKIRLIPETDEEAQATKQAVEQSALRVYAIRSYFAEMFTSLTKIDPARVAQVPLEKRESYLRLRSFTAKYVGFSDTFVVSVPLTDKNEPERVARCAMAVWAVLTAAAAVSMLAITQHIPLRGGLTIGTAVDLFENEAYGAALMDAYRLESTFAQYNRIVIGAELFDYLNQIEDLPPEYPFSEMAKKQAQECRQLICMAPDDSLPMVHIVAPSVMSLPTASGGTWEELRAPAREWVASEAQRFADARDYKLSGRYFRLLRYFDAYAPMPAP